MLLIILFFILIFLASFFSSAEIGFFSLDSAKVRALIKAKKRGSHALAKLKENPQKLIITILIGNNLVHISASVIATVVGMRYFGSAGIAIAFGITTFLILIFGEILPKSFAENKPVKVSLWAVKPIQIIAWLLYPVVIVFEWMTKIIGKEEGKEITETEIKAMAEIGAEKGTIRKTEEKMIKKTFIFGKAKIEKIMTPKKDIFSIKTNISLAQARKQISKHSFSRIPVFDQQEDIVGILYSKDIFIQPINQLDKIKVREIARPACLVSKNKSINALLKEFREKNHNLALVIDENKEIIGLITLEDVLEQLVGKIIDEKD